MYKDFIWDVDGTLFDTYPVIRKIYERILRDELHYENVDFDEIFETILNECSTVALSNLNKKIGLDVQSFKKRYYELEEDPMYVELVTPLEKSLEACRKIKEAGGRNFIVTNRHISIMGILERLDCSDLFTEVVYNGYKGMNKIKPDPEGTNYLIDKYNLDRSTILYVGDRELDYETATNAGIDTCIFKPRETNTCNPKYTIQSFDEIEKFL